MKRTAHFTRGFFNDSVQSAAPSGVHCGNRTPFTINHKDRHAVGCTNRQQNSRTTADESIARMQAQRVRRIRQRNSAKLILERAAAGTLQHAIDDRGVGLMDGRPLKIGDAERLEKAA